MGLFDQIKSRLRRSVGGLEGRLPSKEDEIGGILEIRVINRNGEIVNAYRGMVKEGEYVIASGKVTTYSSDGSPIYRAYTNLYEKSPRDGISIRPLASLSDEYLLGYDPSIGLTGISLKIEDGKLKISIPKEYKGIVEIERVGSNAYRIYGEKYIYSVVLCSERHPCKVEERDFLYKD